MAFLLWKKSSWLRLRILFGALVGLWTLVLTVSLFWNVQQVSRNTVALARMGALTAYEKDVLFRRWNSEHGGVYAPVTPETPPNPLLAHIPERDLVTPSGRVLTLVNPAYMTRQAHEIMQRETGIQGHITSLKPLRPDNAPDAWESKALAGFETGAKEAMTLVFQNGTETLRFMRPLVTEQGCIKCHAHQGYQVGDIRGGISVSLPMAPFRQVQASHFRGLVGIHAGLWLLGLVFMYVGFHRLLSGEEDLDKTRMQLAQIQKLEAVGQLAAGIAHEINTPLQFIGDNTRFMQEGWKDTQRALAVQQRLLDAAQAGVVPPALLSEVDSDLKALDLAYLADEMPKALQQTLDGVEKVTKIVGAMKEFALPTSTERAPTDLNRALDTTLTVTHPEWSSVAELELELDPNLPLVSCQQREINQVLLNLVINASQAIREKQRGSPEVKGQIGIQTSAQEAWVELRVRDTGTGIAADLQHRIFEPFFTTKAVGQGTGQGLTTARSIVHNHGGTIDFMTVPGTGSTFVVRLPIRNG